MIRTITLFVLFAGLLHGQQTTTKTNNSAPFSLLTEVEPGLAPDQFFSAYASQMGLTPQDEFQITRITEGKSGYSHIRYDQTYRGVPIHGQTYILHVKDNAVKSANGRYAAALDLEIKAALTPHEALRAAMADQDAGFYAWEHAGHKHEGHSHAIPEGKPEPKLVIIDKDIPNYSGVYALVYSIDLYAAHPLKGDRYFIDAHNGRVVNKLDLLKHQGVPGQCETRFYGTQELIVDSIAPTEFRLFDPTRGDGGQGVVNGDGEYFTSETADFDQDNPGFVRGAMDAHLATTKFYDALQEHFEWQGLDNNNLSMDIGVFAREEENFVNAFWNGEMAWIGNGNCNVAPLVTHEVVAHEFMHGIIDYTSQLIYADESGAINESMADVMGHVMEFLEDEDRFSWELGSFILNDDVEPFRVMDDPNQKEHPAMYKGLFWEDGAGVHTNSSIGNLLYVLLSEGRVGENETGQSFDISGMGQLQAAQFLFFINKNYLTESSGYNDYYAASLLAAEEFFDGDQEITDNLIEAWNYVGLPTSVNQIDLDLAISSFGFYDVCFFNEFTPVWVEVSNVGSVDYTPDMLGLVEISRNFGGTLLETVAIEDTLRPGESIRYNFDDLILVNDDFISVDYELILAADENIANNEDRDFIFSNEFASNDVSVDLDLDELICFSTEYDFVITIRNESCDLIDEDQEMSVIMRNSDTGEVLHVESFNTENRIFPGGLIRVERTLDLDLDGPTEVVMELSFEGDPNPDNNLIFYDVPILSTVTAGYVNGFESEAALADGVALTSIFATDLHIRDYQANGSYFWTTGFFGESAEVLCEDPIDNFVEGPESIFSGVSAELRACVDLENEPQSYVNFDLIQFSNQNIDFPSQLSSAAQVKWGEGIDEQTIIFGQEEGEVVNHNLALPLGFRGPITFSFHTLTGDQQSLIFDAQFMDNLNFGQLTSTEETELDKVNIFPNPAHTVLFMTAPVGIDDHAVYDFSGRLMSVPGDGNRLDISGLSQGNYGVHMILSDGTSVHKRFVKIER